MGDLDAQVQEYEKRMNASSVRTDEERASLERVLNELRRQQRLARMER